MKTRLLAGCLSLLLLIPAVRAQNEAALSGIVQDASGGVVPQASVKLTNRAQGTATTVQTNQSGIYQFPFVQPGNFDLEVSASGFKTATRTNLIISVAQNARQDFKLELGNVSENVTVVAGSETVNTESAELGAVVDNTKVVELPLNGRTFFTLAQIVPGVLPPVQGSTLGFRGGFNVAGSCEGCNNFTLNGFDNNDPTVNVPNFRPSIDAIQEFNLLTGVAPAQYGYATGGQVVVTTKSGGNAFHGTVFEFLRNQKIMTARNFFAQPGPIPSFKRNQFGATVGGPIRKDKTFFFFSYEGLRQRSAIVNLTAVPSAKMHNGDFSEIAATLRNPFVSGGTFAGNQIPSNLINPVGAALLAYYPLPNIPGVPVGGLNYNFTTIRPEDYNEDSLRLDHTFNSRDSLYLSANYYFDHSTETIGSNCGGNPSIPGFSCYFGQKSQIYGIAETHIFSAAAVNEARIGFGLTYQPVLYNIGNTNFFGQFGIRSSITTVPTIPQYGTPVTNIQGFYGLTGNSSFTRHDPKWQFSDSFSLTRGKHTIRMGGTSQHFATNERNNFNAPGSLTFTNSSTGPTSGYALADLLLGLPASTTNAPYEYPVYLREEAIGLYIQDDYKVNPSLTLNFGLRWELNTPLVDHSHHLTTFDTATGLVELQSNPAPLPPGGPTTGLEYGKLGEHVFHFDWYDYAPRFGFAWQPFHDGKTVVRGGAGTFYQGLNILNGLFNIAASYPYTTSYTYSSSLAQPLSLSNPFPTANAVTSSSVSGINPDFHNTRVYEWSLGVQRQLTKDMVAEVTYFGSSGNHLQVTRNINQPAPGPGTPAAVNARRPYPQWGTVNIYQFNGLSHYHSLQAKVNKRYSYGLSFLASYTFGKSIDDLGTTTNAYDYRTARGLSAFDVRHRFVLSPVYQLPFGKGKAYLSDGVAGRIIGGWQLSSLFQWQTGAPLTPTLTGNFSNTGGTTDRPNVTGDPNANAPHTPQQWFNTAVFPPSIASGQPNAPYTFGDAGRGIITSPGLVNMDLSLVRDFGFRERVKAQFRLEFFNALNHTNFGFPNVIANTPAFGKISSALDPRTSQLALKIVF